MPRILGVDIPNNKKIGVSLTYLYGVGFSNAKTILKKAGVDPEKKADSLTIDELSSIREAIVALGIRAEGELRRLISANIKRLMDIKCYRGVRHKKGLPLRGQKTRGNARTRKGKRKTVGGLKRVLAKK